MVDARWGVRQILLVHSFLFSLDGRHRLFYSFLFVYISLSRVEWYHTPRKEDDLPSGKHGLSAELTGADQLCDRVPEKDDFH